MLGDHGPHEETAIRLPVGAEAAGRGVSAVDQVLCRGGKVVENVLLLGALALVAPTFAVLRPAPHVDDRVDPAPSSHNCVRLLRKEGVSLSPYPP